VEVIVHTLIVEHILMTFQAAFVIDGPSQLCWLDSGVGVICKRIMRPQQFSLNPPINPSA
jgi:hypothetical protein